MGGPNDPALAAVLSGHAPGRAVVDDDTAPRQALLRSEYSFAFLSRGAEQAFLEQAVAQVQREQSMLLVWPSSEKETKLQPPASYLSIVPRFEYRDRRAMGDPPGPLPDGFALRRTDAELLGRCIWRHEVIRACGSAENFLERCFGWCIMRGDEIASEAYAVFRGKGVFEIGVVTARAHRGVGLAVHACHRLIEQCEEQGLRAYWSCHQDNRASNRVAAKLGFTDRRPYRFFLY